MASQLIESTQPDGPWPSFQASPSPVPYTVALAINRVATPDHCNAIGPEEQERMIEVFMRDVVPVLIATGHWYLSIASTRTLLPNLTSSSFALRLVLCALAVLLENPGPDQIKQETPWTSDQTLAQYCYSHALDALIEQVPPGELPGDAELATLVMLVFWEMFTVGPSSDHRLHIFGARPILQRFAMEVDNAECSFQDGPSCLRLALSYSMRSLDLASSKWNACSNLLLDGKPWDMQAVITTMLKKRLAMARENRFHASEARCDLLMIQAGIGQLFEWNNATGVDAKAMTDLIELIRSALEVWSGILADCMAAAHAMGADNERSEEQMALLSYCGTVIYFFQASSGTAIQVSCTSKATKAIFKIVETLHLNSDDQSLDMRIIWPVFMAGTMTVDAVERLMTLQILDKVSRTGLSDAGARDILLSVWQEEVDEGASPSRNQCWARVARQLNYRLLLP